MRKNTPISFSNPINRQFSMEPCIHHLLPDKFPKVQVESFPELWTTVMPSRAFTCRVVQYVSGITTRENWDELVSRFEAEQKRSFPNTWQQDIVREGDRLIYNKRTCRGLVKPQFKGFDIGTIQPQGKNFRWWDSDFLDSFLIKPSHIRWISKGTNACMISVVNDTPDMKLRYRLSPHITFKLEIFELGCQSADGTIDPDGVKTVQYSNNIYSVNEVISLLRAKYVDLSFNLYRYDPDSRDYEPFVPE